MHAHIHFRPAVAGLLWLLAAANTVLAIFWLASAGMLFVPSALVLWLLAGIAAFPHRPWLWGAVAVIPVFVYLLALAFVLVY